MSVIRTQIPVIPVRAKRGEMISGEFVINGTTVKMSSSSGDGTVRYSETLSSLSKSYGKDLPLLVIDADGMRRRDIEPGVLKKMRATRNIWLMTGIRNSGDVMDAFHGDIEKLIVPYHMTTDADLREMTELSDSCFPALFADREGVYARKGKRPLRDVMRTLTNMNFRKILLFAAGDGPEDVLWDVRDHCEMIIPYCNGNKDDIGRIGEMGFSDVLIPFYELI